VLLTALLRKAYHVLSLLSKDYSWLRGTFLCITNPFAMYVSLHSPHH